MNNIYGKLYIVATPIGNLSDITFRAIETLKNVDLIAAEDTRHTQELLNHFEIKTKTTSYHEHNRFEKAERLIDDLKNGKNIAIVTDAGTPIISDPGDVLVKRAIAENIDVTSIPGACAAINALVLSGLDARAFVFVGFISDDKKEREEQLIKLKDEERSMVFYISPHGLNKSLQFIIDLFGSDRNASISREMTKKFEENVRGTLGDIKNYFESKEIKGEFVLVVSGKSHELIKKENAEKWDKMSLVEHMDYYTSNGKTEKEAMKLVAKDRNIDKRDVYKELKVR